MHFCAVWGEADHAAMSALLPSVQVIRCDKRDFPYPRDIAGPKPRAGEVVGIFDLYAFGPDKRDWIARLRRIVALGAGVVIPPWNFPVAILAGMTSASVVTGNTVVAEIGDKPTQLKVTISATISNTFGAALGALLGYLYDAGIKRSWASFLPFSLGPISKPLIRSWRLRMIRGVERLWAVVRAALRHSPWAGFVPISSVV